MRTYVENLPDDDSAEIFGMNENAERSFLELQAKTVVDTIINVQPRMTSDIVGWDLDAFPAMKSFFDVLICFLILSVFYLCGHHFKMIKNDQ